MTILYSIKYTFKQKLSHLGGNSKLPTLNAEWLEIMLQGVLLEGDDLLANHPTLIESLRDDLRKRGGIENKRITIQNNQELKKLMASSSGKINSMIEITRREYACLQNKLSMVILTDYIRVEALNLESYSKIGVVPIFKAMVKANICPNIAILAGGLKVVPKSLIPFVQEKLPTCIVQTYMEQQYMKTICI